MIFIGCLQQISAPKLTGDDMKLNKIFAIICCYAVFLGTLTSCGKDHSEDSTISDSLETTNSIIINSEVIESTSSTEPEINSNNYIGYWHMEGCAEIELTIKNITDNSVSFSYWQHGTDSVDVDNAEIIDNAAKFSTKVLSGSLAFENNQLILNITESSISGVPSNVEMIFDLRILESIQSIQTDTDFTTNSDDIAEITNLNQTIYGQINCKGLSISGYTSSYICENGNLSTVRSSLGDKWHIKSERCCYNYNTLWYECYDSQDEDYYGWIDSKYLDFNDVDTSITTQPITTKPNTSPPLPSTTAPPKETSTEPVTKYQPDIISTQIEGVNFRYINSFHKYYEYIDERLDFDFDIDIKYCNPSDYMSDNSRLTDTWDNNSTFNKKDIGNLYFSAGTDDFAVFEVTLKGNYSGADLIYDKYGILLESGIMFQRFNSFGTLVKSINGQTECMAYQIDKSEGTVNHTIYIGIYKSEISSINFIMFGIDPDYEE